MNGAVEHVHGIATSRQVGTRDDVSSVSETDLKLSVTKKIPTATGSILTS